MFKVGDRVSHSSFGTGTVSFTDLPSKFCVEVLFDNGENEYFTKDGRLWSNEQPSLVKVKVNGGWISVDDKLPDLDGVTSYSTSDMLLVCTETKFVSIGYLRVESDTDGDTYTYWLNSNDERFESKVTHWMEKPQPPVGDKK